LEITDLNRLYLQEGKLKVELFGRGTAWLDAGTHQSLLDLAIFISALQTRQGLQIACPEEIAYRMGFISLDKVRKLAEGLKNTSYGQYLLNLDRHRK
jgi:glucose-1-phosphate thymidylyltransferase